MIFSNHPTYTYNLRKEIIEKLLEANHKIYLVLPDGDKMDRLKKKGCEFIDQPLNRRGKNIITDLKLLLAYNRIVKRIKPDIALTYTIKPNIYGGLVCRLQKIPTIANVTGLGTALINEGFIQKLLVQRYRFAKINCIFFQNENNYSFFRAKKILTGRHRIIPGSGVNLEEYPFEGYPIDDGTVRFLFIGRIMEAKGIQELIEAVKIVKRKYKNVQFDAIGFFEEIQEKRMKKLKELELINFQGVVENVHDYIKKSHAVILPSHHEGMANVLLEAAATGRPVLASNIPGCIETFDEGVTGFGFEAKNAKAVADALIKFINLPYSQKQAMGIKSREKMEKFFDRKIVVNAYLEEINKITEGEG